MPEVSIICPIYNEEPFIEQCIDSVFQQDLPPDKWELLLVDGMSTDLTRRLIEPYLNKHTNIRLLDNPHKTAPYAMNLGINAARGEYIVRIDAHADYPSNYVSTLLHYLQTLPDAANVGAVCRTLPRNNTKKAQAIAHVMSSRFGVGNAAFRTGVSEITEVDTVPFGCWRKSLFEDIGLFDVELTRNQDDEFNAITIQHGYKIYLIPELIVTYYSRDSLDKAFQMYYQYGLFKPLVNTKLKHPATLRQFVPVLFVLGLIIGFILSFLNPVILYVYIAILALYFAITSYYAIIHKNLYIPISYFIVHFSYGCGYLHGLLKLILKKKPDVNSNH